VYATAVAEEKGLTVEAILYMKKAERPTRARLESLVEMIEDPVEDLVRKDSRFKKLELNPADYVGNPTAVVDILEKHGELLQRPVLVRDGKAIVGRPRDRVPEFLS
jgi:arsenate reductase